MYLIFRVRRMVVSQGEEEMPNHIFIDLTLPNLPYLTYLPYLPYLASTHIKASKHLKQNKTKQSKTTA